MFLGATGNLKTESRAQANVFPAKRRKKIKRSEMEYIQRKLKQGQPRRVHGGLKQAHGRAAQRWRVTYFCFAILRVGSKSKLNLLCRYHCAHSRKDTRHSGDISGLVQSSVVLGFVNDILAGCPARTAALPGPAHRPTQEDPQAIMVYKLAHGSAPPGVQRLQDKRRSSPR